MAIVWRIESDDRYAGVIGKAKSISAWVYVSGPDGLLRQAEDACVKLEHEVRAGRRRGSKTGDSQRALEHYVAKWEV